MTSSGILDQYELLLLDDEFLSILIIFFFATLTIINFYLQEEV